MKLGQLKVMVQFILQEVPRTRNSDNALYVEVCHMVAQKKGIDLDSMLFSRVFNSGEFPKYESVSRVRRKIQEEQPELRAEADVEAYRMLQEEEFKKFARN